MLKDLIEGRVVVAEEDELNFEADILYPFFI